MLIMRDSKSRFGLSFLVFIWSAHAAVATPESAQALAETCAQVMTARLARDTAIMVARPDRMVTTVGTVDDYLGLDVPELSRLREITHAADPRAAEVEQMQRDLFATGRLERIAANVAMTLSDGQTIVVPCTAYVPKGSGTKHLDTHNVRAFGLDNLDWRVLRAARAKGLF